MGASQRAGRATCPANGTNTRSTGRCTTEKTGAGCTGRRGEAGRGGKKDKKPHTIATDCVGTTGALVGGAPGAGALITTLPLAFMAR